MRHLESLRTLRWSHSPRWLGRWIVGLAAGLHDMSVKKRLLIFSCNRLGFDGLMYRKQTSKERHVGGANSWMPSVVLEGRVTRSIGALTRSDGNYDHSRFIEMYVHDAAYGYNEGNIDKPSVVATAAGQKLVLPKDTSSAMRRRVTALFERIFMHVRSVNTWVQTCVCAAEEMENMDEYDLQHTVLLIGGKRTREQIRASRDTVGRTVFGCNAGDHGRLRSIPEMCVLCPRAIAIDQASHLIVNSRQLGLQKIPIEHRAFDALYNVLLFPSGYCGWEDGLPLRTEAAAYLTLPAGARTDAGRAMPRGSSALNPRTTTSMCAYYQYRFHWRRGANRTDNCMFMTNRLFQEFACVAFWRVETSRLQIHYTAQKKWRAARATELRAYAQQMAAGGNAEAIGRISYLPASFVGGPTDMYAKYQDAMAAVIRWGPPSLFITMTANPRWPEVLASLPYQQSPSDRYDVVARVFKAKLDQLLKDVKNGMLGVQVSCVYAIEFQKRGLPHAHIVVTLADVDRPRTSEHIDGLSTAELPPAPPVDDDSPEADVQRTLRSLVLDHMVHNDCTGSKGRTCPCWDENKGRCGGHFPFPYTDETALGSTAKKATLRRRRSHPWTANINGRTVTNQWIVPYNADLLLKYQCHLNVEVVTNTYAIKYLFKYVFKGADTASAAIQVVNRVTDQIGNYQDHRYLGAAEAFWRVFKFAIHDLTDHVERMVVETPEERYHCQLSM